MMKFNIIILTFLSAAAVFGIDRDVKPVNLEVSLKKIMLKAEMPQTALIKLQNNTSRKISAELRVEDCHGLDYSKRIHEQNVSMDPGESRTIKVEFKVPDIRFGSEIKSTLKSRAFKVTASNYYTVYKDNPSQPTVRYITTFGRAAPRDGNASEFIRMLRRKSATMYEVFSWSPGMWADMTPRVPYWRSGQGTYPESKKALQDMIRAGHDAGILAATYYQATIYGLSGLEFFRRHPEYSAYNNQGRPIVYFNQLALNKLRREKNIITTGWNMASMRGGFGGAINSADIACIKFGLKQLVDSTGEFGFDGVRWDGFPSLGVYPHSFLGIGSLYFNVKGIPYTKSISDIDRYNADVLKLFAQTMNKAKPGFFRGYNWSPRSTGNLKETKPLAYAEKLKNSFQLDETLVLTSESRTGRSSDPAWAWEPYINRVKASVALLDNTDAAHMSVIHTIPNPVYNRILTTILYACRTRIFGGWHSHPSPDKTVGMAFRYSALIFDKVKPVPDKKISYQEKFHNYLNGIYTRDKAANFEVTAPQKVWWNKFCYERRPDNKTVQDIVHLINPPVKPYRDHKETRTRPPVKNILVKIAKRKGMKIKNIYVLDDEKVDYKYIPDWKISGQWVEVHPEPLKWWNIVAVTWSAE